MLQAYDQLICINRMVYSLLNQRGYCICSTIFFTLFWFLTYFIWLHFYDVNHCDQTTEAESHCSVHKTTGQQPDSIHWAINGSMEQHCCSKQMGIQSFMQLKQAFQLLTDCVCWLINHLLPCKSRSSLCFHSALKKLAIFQAYADGKKQTISTKEATFLFHCIFDACNVLQLQIKPACVGISTKGIPINRLFIRLRPHNNAHLGVFCVFLHFCAPSSGAVLQSATVPGNI